MVVLMTLPVAFKLEAQNASALTVEIKVEKNARKESLLDVMIGISNTATTGFEGYLRLKAPTGFSCISGDSIPVTVASSGKQYIPAKFVMDHQTGAGDALFFAEVFSAGDKLVNQQSKVYTIPATTLLRLSVNKPVVYLYSPHDSAEVSVTVSNSGNTPRMATVVFSIPELSGEKNFFDFAGIIGNHRDTVFTFRFKPSAKLLARGQLTVNIAALGGPEKELLGNAMVQVINVTDTRSFQNVYPGNLTLYSQRNSLSSIYRRMGNNIDIFQFSGNASTDLPAGVLAVNGNIYAMNNDITVNNSYITYQLFENHFKVGNINQALEIPFFGRGAEMTISNRSKSRQWQAGFSDDRFNLVENTPLLGNSYGFYAIGAFNRNNYKNNYSADYIYQFNQFEQAHHHLAGAEMNRSLGKAGDLQLRYHQGYSEYTAINRQRISSAIEARHTASYKKLKTSGNYFYSDPYYPGNRRGVLQVQQTVNRLLNERVSLYANTFILNFAPRSYSYPVHIRSNNTRAEAGLSLADARGNMLSFGYQYQHELNNALGGIAGNATPARLQAHRMVASFNHSSLNRMHSFFVTAEEGLAYYPGRQPARFQQKLNGLYTYRALSLNALYQHGSYFLTEWMVGEGAANSKTYRRLVLSLAFNQSFLSKKLSVSSGAGYINDPMTGKSPSAFANVKYAPANHFALFFNSSWYRYNLSYFIAGYQPVSTGMAEVGFTLNFGSFQTYPGKKGKISALVYYDNNNNNIFDSGDSAAANRQLVLNHTAFKTNSSGKITYKSVPFGRYEFEPVTEQGWFSEKTTITLDRYTSSVSIPLHQSGTASGGISYETDTRVALEFEPRYSNISFDIYNGSGLVVQRVTTDESGVFMSFLPKGSYTIVIDEKTLPPNTFIAGTTNLSFVIHNGTITRLPIFVIKVKEKKRIVKKFGEAI